MNAYCWCYMCGYNAIVKPGFIDIFNDTDQPCPDCLTVGDMSFLNIGVALPADIVEDEFIKSWRPM